MMWVSGVIVLRRDAWFHVVNCAVLYGECRASVLCG